MYVNRHTELFCAFIYALSLFMVEVCDIGSSFFAGIFIALEVPWKFDMLKG
jgi:hypothetical protein